MKMTDCMTEATQALRTSRRVMAPLSLISLISFFGLSGCLNYDHEAVAVANGGEEPSGLFEGASVGVACDADEECRAGLTCTRDLCAPSGAVELGGACVRSDECEEGLRCGWAGFCVSEGTREVGEACGHNDECARGVSCERTGGIAGQCVPRPDGADGLALGEECEGSGLCAEGLVCSDQSGTCIPGSLLLNPDSFRGVACRPNIDAELPFGVRQALPHEEADFFATPFPNDLRIKGGKVDLSAYPTPGTAFGGVDLFDGLLREIERVRKGWSRNPGIYFRLTRPLQEDQRDPVALADRYMRLVDLTTGEDHPFEAAALEGRNKYICHNALYMHPLWSQPLKAGHTYAAMVLARVRDEDGERPQQIESLPMLLGSSTPTDEVERTAWRRYTPLRDWIRDQGAQFYEEDIAGVTVFTVREASTIYAEGREAVQLADVPRFESAPVLCEEGVRSPCATPDYQPPAAAPSLRDPRDCPAQPSAAFHELHARVRLPIFQQGELPYAQEDGDIKFDGDRPKVSSYMGVCMAITIPKGVEMPEDGWPVMLYGHGTGGRFRAGAQLLGTPLSSLMIDDQPTPVAIVAIDQSMHGDRLGDDQSLSPGPLFFNVQNPKAARGNLIQGALDNFALVRFLKQSPSLQGLEVEGIGPISFNTARISYHGHSQGGTTGPLFAPYEDEITGAAFSGAAGGLIFSLLGKKEPYDATVGLRLTLQELDMDEYHPALHVFQELFDDVDPVNFAEQLYRTPHGRPIHALHIVGLRDVFTPDSGQRSYAAASGGTLGKQSNLPADFDLLEDLGLATSPYPIQGNIRAEGGLTITGAVSQFSPELVGGMVSYDGHFVAYRNQEANKQLLRFIGDLSRGDVPSVVDGE